jgi:hypothetical protein
MIAGHKKSRVAALLLVKFVRIKQLNSECLKTKLIMPNLVGEYQTAKSNLLSPGQNLHLVIGQRKKTTPQKPPNYLLQRLSPKEHIFISSLYEWQEMAVNGLTAYSFDFKGVDYVLMINHSTQTAQISVLDKKPVKEAAKGQMT